MAPRTEEFWFDKVEADRVCDFIETMCYYIEGEWAGKPFRLLPWQRKIVRDVFGWKRADGTRRYRTVYIEIPRKCGKSTLLAPLALYMLLCDKESRPQVYSAAGDRAQASIVFDMARDIVAGNPDLGLMVKSMQHRLIGKNTHGFYTAVSAEAYSKHGMNASAIFFDELHVQPNRKLWDVLTTSQGARKQPLTVAITTAGYDRQSLCWEVHQRAERAIADPDSDPYFYGVIFGASPTDDWTSEEVWAKANPSLGHTLKIEYLREMFDEAKDNPAVENTFRNLHLNQWTETAIRAIPMDKWDRCNHSASERSLVGQPCYMGVDLASTRDIAAVSLVFPQYGGHFAVLPYFWIPEQANSKRAEQDRGQFRGWITNGQIETTPGNQIDYACILDKIMELAATYQVREVALDPWNAVQFSQSLIAQGMPESQLFMFRQSYANYNEPATKLLSLVTALKLDTGANPVLRWMASNTAFRRDTSGNVRPDKESSGAKIDGITATLMGLGRALAANQFCSPTVTFV